jgi:hypothetical protein
MEEPTAERQLAQFLSEFTPEIEDLARSALTWMQARLPNAVQLVYDNYNALVVGFGPSERASEAIFSIAVYPRSVALCFLQSAALADPEGRLKGSGTVSRHVVLEHVGVLNEPAIRDLMSAALESAVVRMNPAQEGRMVIRSISAKQRPRRPTG